MTVLCIRPQLS